MLIYNLLSETILWYGFTKNNINHTPTNNINYILNYIIGITMICCQKPYYDFVTYLN